MTHKITNKTIEFLKTARADAVRQAAFAHKCCNEVKGNRHDLETYIKRRAFWLGYSIALKDIYHEIKGNIENDKD